MKKVLKVLGLVAMSAAVSAAVTYVMERVQHVRGFDPPDWGGEEHPLGDRGEGSTFQSPFDTTERPFGQCHHMPGCSGFCWGASRMFEEGDKKKYFCPYGGIPGCNKTEVGTDGVTCKYVGGPNCPGVTYNPAAESAEAAEVEVETAPEGFCPYNEVGCLSPKDFDEGVTVCPCADSESCLRKHTFEKPGADAFGGEYGGHGLHAEQVAFGDKDISGGTESATPEA